MGLVLFAVVVLAIIVGIAIFRVVALRADRRKAERDANH